MSSLSQLAGAEDQSRAEVQQSSATDGPHNGRRIISKQKGGPKLSAAAMDKSAGHRATIGAAGGRQFRKETGRAANSSERRQAQQHL